MELRKSKFFSLFLSAIMAFSFASCSLGGGNSDEGNNNGGTNNETPGGNENEGGNEGGGNEGGGNTGGEEGGGNVELPNKVLSESLFSNPSLSDRPMVMMHSASTTLIDDVYNRGYGGIATNVAWGSDYLQSDRAFSRLSSCVQHAADKGMYVWLYDEYGYPSGTAYGQTLDGNPEYEALGLIPQYKVVGAGSSATVNLVYGHKEIVAAYVYDGTSVSNMDLNSGVSVTITNKNSLTYNNRSSKSKVLVVYMSKQWYENTHAMENWYIQQRYINMLDKEPTEKFVSITHDQYYAKLSPYFGSTIKAFFTDEPALQGSYFGISNRNRIVLDTPDMNIPIIECLNYSDTLFNSFHAKYGYELQPYLWYLYNDDGSVKAKQVRMDFYLLTGELFGQNYLGTIENWCGEHNVKSSGHLLLEETLYQNPWFAGNMIQLLGTMGIPGTDLLKSEPIGAMADASIVSKMASSAADFQGKEDTFAEISGAFDGTVGDIYDQINAVGAQVCMGINTFASYYYQGDDHTLDEDKVFSTAIGRMRYMTTGAKHTSKVAVYYPYEGVAAETLPSKNMYEPTAGARAISDNFRQLCNTLVSKQVDYDLVDYLNLSQCTVSGNALVTPSGERFTAIVIPQTTALHSKAVEKLLEAAKAGVKVILVNVDYITCETGKNDVTQKFDELYDLCHWVSSPNGAGNYLRNNGYTYAKLNDEGAERIYISKRENSNYSVFTVVNAYEVAKSYEFTLTAQGSKVKFYDTITGEIKTVSGVNTSRGTCTFTYTLPANRTGFFVVEK